MPIYIGGKKVTKLMIGNDVVSKVYRGTDLIYQSKKEPTISITLVSSLTYSGSALRLISSASCTGGTAYYGYSTSSTTEPSSWVTSYASLTATNAGTYYVWYKVTGNTGYSSIEPTYKGSVAISKGTPTVSITLKSGLAYNESYQYLISSMSTTGGTLYVAVSTSSSTTPTNWYQSVSNIEGLNAGTYYIWYKVSGNSDWNDIEATMYDSVTIDKGTRSAGSITLASSPIYRTSSGYVELVTAVSSRDVGCGYNTSYAQPSGYYFPGDGLSAYWRKSDGATVYYIYYYREGDDNYYDSDIEYAGSIRVLEQMTLTMNVKGNGINIDYSTSSGTSRPTVYPDPSDTLTITTNIGVQWGQSSWIKSSTAYECTVKCGSSDGDSTVIACTSHDDPSLIIELTVTVSSS